VTGLHTASQSAADMRRMAWPLEFVCQALHIAESGQRLII
jgi:hypothetical protein